MPVGSGMLVLGYGLVLLHTLPLVARRRFPGAVLVLSVASGLAGAALFLPPFFLGPAILVDKVESLLLRGGGWALVVGRCTAGARVVLPGLAGMLGLRYRVFVLWTGAAAMVWAVAHVLLGYAAGASWRQVHHLTGRVGLLLAGAVLVAVAVVWLVHRPAKRHEDESRQPVAAGRHPD
jgi:membrane protein DedA with SNARE-associated domain